MANTKEKLRIAKERYEAKAGEQVSSSPAKSSGGLWTSDTIRQKQNEARSQERLANDYVGALGDLNKAYSSWQDTDTMSSIQRSVGSVADRLNERVDYLASTDLTKQQRKNKTLDSNLAVSSKFKNDIINRTVDDDIRTRNSTKTAANTMSKQADSLKELSNYYSQWDSKDSYDADRKYKSLSYEQVQKLLSGSDLSDYDRNYLENYGADGRYTSPIDYDKDIAARENSKSQWTPIVSGISQGDTPYTFREDMKAPEETTLDKVKANRNVAAVDNRFDYYKGYMNAPDYEAKSLYNPATKDYTYRLINTGEGDAFDTYQSLAQYMTDDEKGVYNYLYQTDKDKAKKYLEKMVVTTDKRMTAADDARAKAMAADQSTGKNILDTILSVAPSIAGNIMGGASNIVNAIQGKEVNPYSATNRLSNAISSYREGMGDQISNGSNVAKFLYDTGVSMLDTLGGMGAAKLGADVYGMSMGLGAAQQQMKELKDSGASDSQVLIGGSLSGIAEGFFEEYSLEKLLEIKDVESIGRLFKSFATQAFTEGSEEVFTEIANIIIDGLNRGSMSDYNRSVEAYMAQGMSESEARSQATKDMAKQVALAGLGGAISGGVLGGIEATGSFINNKVTGSKAKNEISDTRLVEAAKNLPSDSEFNQSAQKYNADKLTDAQRGSLLNHVGEETVNNAYKAFRSETATEEDREKAVNNLLNLNNISLNAAERTAASGSEGISTGTQNFEGKVINTFTKGDEQYIKTTNGVMKFSDAVMSKENKAAVGYATQITDRQERIAFLSNYDGKTDITEYVNAFNYVYRLGVLGMNKSKVNVSNFTKEQIDNIYSIGREATETARVEVETRRQQEAEADEKIASELVSKYFKVTGEYKTGTYDTTALEGVELTREQRLAITVGQKLHEAMGAPVNVKYFVSEKDENGNFNAEQGRYENGTIYVDAMAGFKNLSEGSTQIMQVLSHELTHWAEKKAPLLYKQLSDTVLDALAAERGVTRDNVIATEIKNLERLYKDNGIDSKVDEKLAISELVARASEGMLTDEKAFEKYTENMAQNQKVRFAERIQKLFSKLRDFFRGLASKFETKSSEWKELNRQADLMEQAKEKWAAMIEKAVRVGQAEKAAGEFKEDSNSMFAIRTDFYSEFDEWVKNDFSKMYNRALNDANYLDSLKNRKQGRRFWIGTTSSALQGAGAIESDVYMTEAKIVVDLVEHPELAIDDIKKIPKILEKPALALKSKNVGRQGMYNDRLVLIGNEKSSEEGYAASPLVVALSLGNYGMNDMYFESAQKIVSLYPKTVGVKNLIKNSFIVYADTKKATRLLKSIGFSTPINLVYSGFIGKIISNINGTVNIKGERFDDVFTDDKGRKLYSLRDSEGNNLTEQQAEYFKDSKVRDAEGNLLVMYHGTSNSGFTVFNNDYGISSKAFFFTNSLETARGYSGTHDIFTPKTFKNEHELINAIEKDMRADNIDVKNVGGEYKLYEDGELVDSSKRLDDLYQAYNEYSGFGGDSANYKVYLNATNPLVIDAKGSNWESIKVDFSDETMTTNAIAEYALKNGYDGVIIKNVEDNGLYMGSSSRFDLATDAIVFNSNQIKDVNNQNPTSNEDIRYSLRITDKDTLDFLNKQVERGEYYTTYKSMSFWGYDEDGNAILRSPMAEYVDGKLSDAYLLRSDGKLDWYKSTEDIDEATGMPRGLLAEIDKKDKSKYPSEDIETSGDRVFVKAYKHKDVIADDWSNCYFMLNKKVEDGVKKNGEPKYKNSPVPARYAPYEHSSNLMLNDQFESAWRRANLVTVKMYVPYSEANGSSRTKYAKDSTGWTEWHSGIVASSIRKQKPSFDRQVFLSNYAAPVEIVSDMEVARAYKEYVSGTNIQIPDNVVSPNLLEALKKVGVPIKVTGKVKFKATNDFGINERNQSQFSLRQQTPDLVGETDKLRKQNERLQEDVNNLKERLKLEKRLTNGQIADKEAIRKIASKLIKENGLKYDADTLTDELADIFNETLKPQSEGDFVPLPDDDFFTIADNEPQGLEGKISALARSLAGSIKSTEEVPDTYRDLLDTIRKTTFYVTETEYKDAVAAAGGKAELSRMLRGKIKITTTDKNEYHLDSFLSEYAEEYRDIFKYNSEGEHLTDLLDTYNDMREAVSVVKTYYDMEAENYFKAELLNMAWQLPAIKTTADKWKAKVDALRLEHSKMMQETRQEYRDKARQSVKDQREADAIYYGRVINKLREQRNASYAAGRAYGKQRLDAYKDRQARQAEIKKITDKAKTLISWYNTNNKDKHIAKVMQAPVRNFLEALDFSSEQLLGKRGGEKAGTPTQRDISLAKAFRGLANFVGDANGQNTKESDVKSQLNTYLDIPMGYQESLNEISDKLEALAEKRGDNVYVLNDLSLDELIEVRQDITILKSLVTNVNRLIANASYANCATCAQNTIRTADAMSSNGKGKGRFSDFMNWTTVLPYYAFQRFGEGGQSIFAELMDGYSKFAFKVKEVFDFENDIFGTKEEFEDKAHDWSREVHEVEVKEGKKIKITTAQLMSLYCINKRELRLRELWGDKAPNHLRGGGIKVADIKDSKNNISQAGDTGGLSETTIENMTGILTDEQRAVADKLQHFMTTTCSDWGNETSMKRFGIDSFTEDMYFPIKSDENNIATEANDNENSLFRLLNMSFTKSLTKGANNAVTISNIFDVFVAHTTDMAKYNSLAIPVLDAFKWLSYTEKTEKNKEGSHDTVSLKASLERAFGGKAAETYIKELLKDLNASQKSGRDEALSHKLMSNAKVAAVAFNLRVAALQPTAYFRASAVLSASDMLAGFAKPSSYKKAQEWSGMAYWKSLGLYDINIQKSVTDMLKGEKTLKDKIVDLGLKGAEWGDKLTWGHILNACEHNIKRNNPDMDVNSDAFKQAVAKKFDEVVVSTQVIDTPLTKTQIMRSKGGFAKLATNFMAEPMVSLNIFTNAVHQFKDESARVGKGQALAATKGLIVKSASAYIITATANAIAEALMDALRAMVDEDDDDFAEAFAMKYRDNFWGNFVEDMSLLSKIPYAKELYSIFRIGDLAEWMSSEAHNGTLGDTSITKKWMSLMSSSYSSSRMDTQVFDTARKSIVAFYKALDTNEIDYKKVYSWAQLVSQATGIPVSSAFRDFRVVWNDFCGSLGYDSMKLFK